MDFILKRKAFSNDLEQIGDNQMFKITKFARRPNSEDMDLSIEPTGKRLTLTAHGTFTKNDGRVFLINGGAASRNFNPSGSFDDLTEVIIINKGASNNIVFDSSGANQTIPHGQWAHCFYGLTEDSWY